MDVRRYGRFAGFVLALAAPVGAASCGDDGGNEAGVDVDTGVSVDGGSDPGDGRGCAETVDGVCLPEAPQGATGDDCPSGELAFREDFSVGGVCLPRLHDWECPAGWIPVPARASDADGLKSLVALPAVCRPPEMPTDCPPGAMPVVGVEDCVEHGGACPDGGWPSESDIRGRAPGFDGALVYVSPAADGGDGSRDAPFARIGRALSAAEDGGIVALAAGTYVQRVLLTRRVAVVGACVADTRIEAPGTDDSQPTVLFSGAAANALLTNVTVGGEAVGVGFDGTVLENRLEDSRVSQTRFAGVAVYDAASDVKLRRVYVYGVRERAGARTFGRGVFGEAESVVRAERLTVEGCREIGIGVFQGASFTLIDTAVVDTASESAGLGFGRGVSVEGGGHLDTERLVIARNRDVGLFSGMEGSSATVRFALITETGDRASDSGGGRGIGVQEGAALDAEHVLVEQSAGVGLLVSAASAELRQVVVRGTEGSAVEERSGSGVVVQTGADVDAEGLLSLDNRDIGIIVSDGTLELASGVVFGTRDADDSDRIGAGVNVQGVGLLVARSSLFEHNDAVGLQTFGADATAELTDVVIREGRPRDGELGRGGSIEDGSVVTGDRVVAVDNHAFGFFVADRGAQLVLRDSVVRGTRPRVSDARAGRGVEIVNAATLRAERVRFAENHSVGIFAGGPNARVVLDDVAIVDTAERAADGALGRGLSIENGAGLEANALLVDNARDVGVLVFDGAAATLSDTVVRGTRKQACVDVDTACDGGGAGISSIADAEVDITRFAVVDNALAGLQVARGAALRASSGTLRENPIGLNVQSAVFDLEADVQDVVLADNLRDVATDELPLPTASESASSPAD